MQAEGSITVDRLWKRFRPDHRLLFRDGAERILKALRGERHIDWRWALRDVSFTVEPGESIGLIGVNGAGKTTLLKILSRIMFPSSGTAVAAGRVGGLVGVTAGLHQDLTGRENVYVFGSLLGFKRREIAARFDDIVAFAELEDAIDRQTKFYSSGMGMRLAFSIASMLEPDTLLVDEVLAVGDASFQQKCLRRMREILDGGATLFYVSHDLGTVQALCQRAIWLADGAIVADGPCGKVVDAYLAHFPTAAVFAGDGSGPLEVSSVSLTGPRGAAESGRPADVRLHVNSTLPEKVMGTWYLGAGGSAISPTFLVCSEGSIHPGPNRLRCSLATLPLPGGLTHIWAGFVDPSGHDVLPFRSVGQVEVRGAALPPVPTGVLVPSPIYVPAEWALDGPEGERVPDPGGDDPP